MTARAGLLLALAGGAIVSATSGPHGGGAGREGAVEPKLSFEECRRIAARFLGVRPDELERNRWGPAATSDGTVPPMFSFVLPYPPTADVEDWQRERGRVQIGVNAWDGQVEDADYPPREWETGSRRLTEDEAKAAAEAYLKAHWPQWGLARFLKARRQLDFPSTVKRAPEQSFEWVVEQRGIRVGWAFVTVNVTTGGVTRYAQWYYPADGLPPPRLSKDDAVKEAGKALAQLPDEQRGKTRLTECSLLTSWRSGKTVLVWKVTYFVPARTSRGYDEHMGREFTMMLDAHTGEVYHRLLPPTRAGSTTR